MDRYIRKRRFAEEGALPVYNHTRCIPSTHLQVISPGDGPSTKPVPQGRVTMRMRGILPSGKNVDKHSAVTFIVGDGDVIQGTLCTLTIHSSIFTTVLLYI